MPKGWSRMAGAFEDLRVLDLSWGIAGPMTTMFLADNGADVIRIEPPWRPLCPADRLSGLEPGQAQRPPRPAERRGTTAVQRDGGDIRRRRRQLLIGDDGEARHRPRRPQSRVNPGLITCSITAYGEHGAHRDRPGYDGLVAARTGLLYRPEGSTGDAHGVHLWPSRPLPRVRRARRARPRAPIETGRSSPALRGRASARPTSRRSGSPLRCELDR